MHANQESDPLPANRKVTSHSPFAMGSISLGASVIGADRSASVNRIDVALRPQHAVADAETLSSVATILNQPQGVPLAPVRFNDCRCLIGRPVIDNDDLGVPVRCLRDSLWSVSSVREMRFASL